MQWLRLKHQILEMQSVRMSLEDIFLKVTEENNPEEIGEDIEEEVETDASVYKKELRSYFTSMIGYVFIAFSLIIIGISFYRQNLTTGMQTLNIQLLM